MELEKLDAWRPLLAEELKKPYFAALAERVDAAYETQTVFRRVKSCSPRSS